MKIIGISPLDKDSTVCLVEDGKVICAVAEERFSRIKMHEGFPYRALADIFERYNLSADQIDFVTYSFFEADEEKKLMEKARSNYFKQSLKFPSNDLFSKFRNRPKAPAKKYNIPSLSEDKLYMAKPWYMNILYTMGSKFDVFGKVIQKKYFDRWIEDAYKDHCHYQTELYTGLKKFGLKDKLIRLDHHMTHSANAYFTSGFNEALILTIDGYGSGLAGSVAVGKDGQIKRIHEMPYPVSLGEFYERVTSSLGFKPSRHEGKIVGLAAYEDPDILYDLVRSFFEVRAGEIFYQLPHNFFFSRYLASCYSKPAVAAAYQKVLEVVCCEYLEYYIKKTGIKNVVLSGGVVANVKANQRLFEECGTQKIFVHPNMGDGGCCVGGALLLASQKQGIKPEKISDVYWGPEFSGDEIEQALVKAGLIFEKLDDIEERIAQLLVDGNIIARFNGRMEYGPRALGNRSILYHAKDPSVNLWLNQQLKRTEFMPFAPATLYEERANCYKNSNGAEYTAQFMTITFDTTDFMLKQNPAAVHVDATARPQLVSLDTNKSFYKIIKAYQKLTGNSSIINTSFNMHEEPIVCTPQDAITAFQQGHLHYLAIGPYLVKGNQA